MLFTILMTQVGDTQKMYQIEGDSPIDALVHWAEGTEYGEPKKAGSQQFVQSIRNREEDEHRFVGGYDHNQPEYYTNVWTFDEHMDSENGGDTPVETSFIVIKTAKG
jgi:hypothetical protein